MAEWVRKEDNSVAEVRYIFRRVILERVTFVRFVRGTAEILTDPSELNRSEKTGLPI
jgi:hypothetical protein